MAWLILIPAIYLAAVLETSLAPLVEVHGVVPDLFALVASVWLLQAGRERGFLTAAAIGLACDLTAAGPPGIGMGAFALVGYGLGRLRDRLDFDHFFVQLGLLWATVATISLLEATAWRLTSETVLPWPTLAVRAVMIGTYTAVVALPLLLLLKRFGRPRSAALA